MQPELALNETGPEFGFNLEIKREALTLSTLQVPLTRILQVLVGFSSSFCPNTGVKHQHNTTET